MGINKSTAIRAIDNQIARFKAAEDMLYNHTFDREEYNSLCEETDMLLAALFPGEKFEMSRIDTDEEYYQAFHRERHPVRMLFEALLKIYDPLDKILFSAIDKMNRKQDLERKYNEKIIDAQRIHDFIVEHIHSYIEYLGKYERIIQKFWKDDQLFPSIQIENFSRVGDIIDSRVSDFVQGKRNTIGSDKED